MNKYEIMRAVEFINAAAHRANEYDNEINELTERIFVADEAGDTVKANRLENEMEKVYSIRDKSIERYDSAVFLMEAIGYKRVFDYDDWEAGCCRKIKSLEPFER